MIGNTNNFITSLVQTLKGVLTTKGDILGFGTTETRLPVGADTQVLTADSAQSLGIKWATPSSFTSPLTTKGDIFGFDTDDARIPIGSDGQILTADSAQALGLKWADPPIFAKIIKSVDQTVNNSSTLVNDDELTVALSANKRYMIWMNVFFVSSNTPDFKCSLTLPSGTTQKVISNDLHGFSTSEGFTDDPTTTTVQSLTITAEFSLIFQGYVLTSGTAGNLTLQWAQASADASDTDVKAGSSLIVFEV
jgi:hypothetical protein